MSVKPGSCKVRWWWAMIAGLSVAAFVTAMGYQSAVWHGANVHGDSAWPLVTYWVFYTASWLAIGLLLWRAMNQTWKDSGRAAVWVVLFVAIGARVAVVVTTQPVLSDDIWRYVHDGATLGNGANPYVLAPGDMDRADAPVPGVMDRMNNTEFVTIYQPTSQYVFVALDRVWELSPAAVKRWDPDHDKVFRLGFMLFDMGLIVLLLWRLRDMGRSAWWAAAYVWHPLAISEVAGSGHQDTVGVALLVLTLGWAMHAQRDREGGHRGWLAAVGAGVAFGLAIGVKPVVLPIALALAWYGRGRPGRVALAAASTVATGVAIYLPFVLMDGGLAGMFDTAQTFIDKWAFNGSAYDLFVRYIAGKPLVDYLAAAVLLTVIVVTSLQKHGDAARVAGAFLFASLLVSSTVHPWYLLWALALLPLYFSPALWVFSLTIAASYAAHLHPEYRVPTWVVVLEYLPVYALLCWAGWVWVRRRSTGIVSTHG